MCEAHSSEEDADEIEAPASPAAPVSDDDSAAEDAEAAAASVAAAPVAARSKARALCWALC